MHTHIHGYYDILYLKETFTKNLGLWNAYSLAWEEKLAETISPNKSLKKQSVNC